MIFITHSSCKGYFHSHTFAHMTNLTRLDLRLNKLKSFNPNYMPDSIRFLTLSSNKLTSFKIERPFNNLIELALDDNDLEKFTLNLKNQLPVLEKILLQKNVIRDLNIIDSPNNRSDHLKYMDLSSNAIDALDVWQWRYDNWDRTYIDLNDTFPLCDCNSFEIINDLNAKWPNSYFKNQILTCRPPLTKFAQAQIAKFPCGSHNDCVEYQTVRSFSLLIDQISGDYLTYRLPRNLALLYV